MYGLLYPACGGKNREEGRGGDWRQEIVDSGSCIVLGVKRASMVCLDSEEALRRVSEQKKIIPELVMDSLFRQLG